MRSLRVHREPAELRRRKRFSRRARVPKGVRPARARPIGPWAAAPVTTASNADRHDGRPEARQRTSPGGATRACMRSSIPIRIGPPKAVFGQPTRITSRTAFERSHQDSAAAHGDRDDWVRCHDRSFPARVFGVTRITRSRARPRSGAVRPTRGRGIPTIAAALSGAPVVTSRNRGAVAPRASASALSADERNLRRRLDRGPGRARPRPQASGHVYRHRAPEPSRAGGRGQQRRRGHCRTGDLSRCRTPRRRLADGRGRRTRDAGRHPPRGRHPRRRAHPHPAPRRREVLPGKLPVLRRAPRSRGFPSSTRCRDAWRCG